MPREVRAAALNAKATGAPTPPLLWRDLRLAAVAGVIAELHPACQSQPHMPANGRFHPFPPAYCPTPPITFLRSSFVLPS